MWILLSLPLLATAAPANRTAILGGRFTLELPPEARLTHGAHGLMEAATSDEDETRIVVDHDTERLVLIASETYKLAPENLVRPELAKALRPWSPRTCSLTPTAASCDSRPI